MHKRASKCCSKITNERSPEASQHRPCQRQRPACILPLPPRRPTPRLPARRRLYAQCKPQTGRHTRARPTRAQLRRRRRRRLFTAVETGTRERTDDSGPVGLVIYPAHPSIDRASLRTQFLLPSPSQSPTIYLRVSSS